MDNKMYPYRSPMMQPLQPDSELARAYVPFQIMGKIYSCKEALEKGTLFPELYKPYKYEDKKKSRYRR